MPRPRIDEATDVSAGTSSPKTFLGMLRCIEAPGSKGLRAPLVQYVSGCRRKAHLSHAIWHRSRRQSIALCERSVTSILRRQARQASELRFFNLCSGRRAGHCTSFTGAIRPVHDHGEISRRGENIIPLLNAFAYNEWSFEVFDSGRDTEASIPSWYFIMLATTQTRRMTRPPHSPCCHSSQHALADV